MRGHRVRWGENGVNGATPAALDRAGPAVIVRANRIPARSRCSATAVLAHAKPPLEPLLSNIASAGACKEAQQDSYQLSGGAVLNVAPNSPAARLIHAHSVTERIVTVFDQCFAAPDGLNTRLRGGFEEPYYRPADQGLGFHQIEFTRDYPASALHEAAHWCVAGAERRLLADYGYWYAPDGRSVAQQQEFERVEVKPQALEWIFARACGMRFRVSADNLDAGLGPSERFKGAIWQQVQQYCTQGINPRATLFARSLAVVFECADPLQPSAYRLEDLV
nr:elongation factor P hydroxylase [Microbulbifer sp. CAU 1566]